MANVARRAAPPALEDHVVYLEGATWADYGRLLELRGERAVPRISYLDGRLELMTPSFEHDGIAQTIGCLLEVYCLEHDIDFKPVGSWTIKDDEKRKSGAEPDQCYVFRDLEPRPKRPDLAIEVTWTSGRIDKLEIYRRLGVPEVWYWREGKIDPFVLRGGRYFRVARSHAVPGIDLAEIAKLVDKPGFTSKLMRAYRTTLRQRRRAAKR